MAPVFAIVLAVAGCAVPQSQPLSGFTASAAKTLVGSWRYSQAVEDLAAVDLDECETDWGATYGSDSSFIGYDESGEWRIESNILSEIIWEPEASSGLFPRVKNPEIRRWRMEWLSTDVINLHGVDEAGRDLEETSALVRCPHAE